VSSIAGLTDRGTVAAYVIVNTTTLSGPNYTTSRDVTGHLGLLGALCARFATNQWSLSHGWAPWSHRDDAVAK
jgi:hypothetical protein